MVKKQPVNPIIQPVWVGKESDPDRDPDIVTDTPPRPGKLCPKCKRGLLDYDGVLNLICPVCGHTFGGCFT